MKVVLIDQVFVVRFALTTSVRSFMIDHNNNNRINCVEINSNCLSWDNIRNFLHFEITVNVPSALN